MTPIRLTRRGRVVAWILGLAVAWLVLRYFQAGFDECMARGYGRAVCGM